MPPVLPSHKVHHLLDENLAIFKNELKVVGLLEEGQDWYDFEYTKNSEANLINKFTCLKHPEGHVNTERYVFKTYDNQGNMYDTDLIGAKKSESSKKIEEFNIEHHEKYPYIFPKSSQGLHVYDGEVLKELFLEYGITIQTINSKKVQNLLDKLTQSLNSTEECVKTHFYQSCYEYYGKMIRKGQGHKGINQGELIYELIEEEGKEDIWVTRYNPQTRTKEGEGFPQGSPISPILCSAILGDSVFKVAKCLMYADDGLFYSDEPLFGGSDSVTTNEAMLEANLSFAPDKSGWVKKEGKWLKPLKFLGLVYDGQTDSLYASTKDKFIARGFPLPGYDIKKGSRLELSSDQTEMVESFITESLKEGYGVANDIFKGIVEIHSSEESFNDAVNKIKLSQRKRVTTKDALTKVPSLAVQQPTKLPEVPTLEQRVISLGEYYKNLEKGDKESVSYGINLYIKKIIESVYEELLPGQ
jgi:hypothetical protein